MQRATLHRLVTVAACAATAAVVVFLPTRVSSPQLLAMPAGSATETPTPSARPSHQPSATPDSSRDRVPPAPVSDLHLSGNDARTFTVVWRPATDNIEVTQYLVLLNGSYATRTTSLGANFTWFDNTERILVQVAALDAAGNRSQWRSLYIIPPPEAGHPQRTTRQLPAPPLDYQTAPAPRPTRRATARPNTSSVRTPTPDPTATASTGQTSTPKPTPPKPRPTPSVTPKPSTTPTVPVTPKPSTTPTRQTPKPAPSSSSAPATDEDAPALVPPPSETSPS